MPPLSKSKKKNLKMFVWFGTHRFFFFLKTAPSPMFKAWIDSSGVGDLMCAPGSQTHDPHSFVFRSLVISFIAFSKPFVMGYLYGGVLVLFGVAIHVIHKNKRGAKGPSVSSPTDLLPTFTKLSSSTFWSDAKPTTWDT